MSGNYARKIDISVEQLRGIYAQLLEALQEKGASSLPNGGSKDDEQLHRELQIYLQEYLVHVIEMASGSLNIVNVDSNGDIYNMNDISGLLAHTQDKYVEPFDSQLNESVRQKYQEWEDLTIKVSQLRRNGPEKVNELYNHGRDEFFHSMDTRIDALTLDLENKSEESTTELDTSKVNALLQELPQTLQQLTATKEQIPETRADIDRLHTLLAFLQRD